jgi:hypothetical protein
MLGRLTACVVAAVLLGGCGGDSEDATSGAGVETRSATSSRTYEVASAGFAIALPEPWGTITADQSDAVVEEVVGKTPSLQDDVGNLRFSGSRLKLVAADPRLQAGVATELQILVDRLPDGITRAEYERLTVTGRKALLFHVQEIDSQEVDIPAGKAFRTSTRVKFTEQGKTYFMRGYVLVAAGVAYELTFTTLSRLADDYERMFTESARSFRLVERRP